MTISAYLQIYNDDDFLKEALASVQNYVDELVVVDGCYEWMSHYHEKRGNNPTTSRDSTYEILEESKIPYTSIKKVWGNQLEKRTAGYASCKSRYIMRMDSDEIFNFDETKLDNFLSSNFKVAKMDMPEMLTPELIIQGHCPTESQQCFLFDSNYVSPVDHLHYLWLVLHVDKVPSEYIDLSVCEEPIALNLHLTHWRSPNVSVNRSSYYTMNWMRKNGFPGLDHPNSNIGIENFEEFFEKKIPVKEFEGLCQYGEIPMGKFFIPENQVIVPAPLNVASGVDLKNLYQKYRENSESFYSIAPKKIPFISGTPFYLDISPNAVNISITGTANNNIIDAKAMLSFLSSDPPYNHSENISTAWLNSALKINITNAKRDFVRMVIKITIWSDKSDDVNQFTIEKFSY